MKQTQELTMETNANVESDQNDKRDGVNDPQTAW